ncbi:S41 family peptidase [Mucilaginibacter puniceus]
MKKLIYLFLILSAGLIISCKKDNKPDNNNTIAPSKTGSTLDLIRDSIYLYAQESYLWYDGLPDYATFNPRSISGTNDLSALVKEVDKLSQYKINPITNKPYEYYEPSPGEAKYSFIDEGGTSAQLGGVNGDFGFAPLYNTTTDLRIKYVYAGSPAAAKGIKRGYQITKINGQTNLTYDNGGATTQFVVNAMFNSSTVSMTLKRPDNTTFDVDLAVANYNVNPVIIYKVIDLGGGKKVGYIVFNSFVTEDVAKPKLQEAFNSFTANGITDLVVDLRYNGGGYVSTAEYLSNLIVPAGKTGSAMYTTYFNDKLAAGKASILANQIRKDPTTGRTYNYAQFDYTPDTENFAKEGSLNITGKVFFIVSGNTASSSELLINNLRPHMNVQLIGTKTYGKPVGFFDIQINKYELYVPQFVTKNSAGQGDYFDGMLPGSINYPGIMDYDDVTKEFGDPTEGLLAHALNFVKTGNYTSTVQSNQSVDAGLRSFSVLQSREAALKLDDHKFNGMVHDKPLKIK